jgi:hypothetical protein
MTSRLCRSAEIPQRAAILPSSVHSHVAAALGDDPAVLMRVYAHESKASIRAVMDGPADSSRGA